MKFIYTLAFRNLIRQKRRNILLGIAIAIGVSLLIIANSFSEGISDILFNKIIVRITGHVSVNFWEKGSQNRQIFRDKEKILKIIHSSFDKNFLEMEESIGVFGRAINNGKADNTVLVGINRDNQVSEQTKKDLKESFRMIEGSFDDLSNKKIENPAIISVEKAKFLHVTKGDTIKFKFQNIYGQNQAAKLTVVGITKNSNIFMQNVIFTELQNEKKMMGYSSHDIGSLSINIKNPKKNAVKLADKIHSKLTSQTAIVEASTKNNDAVLFGLKVDKKYRREIHKFININQDTLNYILENNGVLISKSFAKKLNIKTDDEISIKYKNKFKNETVNIGDPYSSEIKLKVKGIYDGDSNYIFMNEIEFYNFYYINLPTDYDKAKYKNLNYPFLATEWDILPRTTSTDDYQKKVKDVGKKKWRGTAIDVSTMYETASDVLKLEGVLQLITFTAVLILFFIILIGVVNTLRMSIKERTQEIGTMRAIGIQKKDLIKMFIYEILFLSLLSSIAGIIISIIAMKLLKLITFNLPDNPLGILLLNDKLYFLTKFTNILLNILLIIVISLITTFFPAKKASQINPVEALRHFE